LQRLFCRWLTAFPASGASIRSARRRPVASAGFHRYLCNRRAAPIRGCQRSSRNGAGPDMPFPLSKPAELQRSAAGFKSGFSEDCRNEEKDMKTLTDWLATHWRDAANLILGLWLAISPWALSYAMEAIPTWNALIVGVIIVVAAAAALFAFHKWEEWVNVVLAVWLIASPFALEFASHTTVLWNYIIVGVLVGILALWTALTTPEAGITAGS
jgi:SPW repeat